MADSPTPEQRAADDALRAAVAQAMEAYAPDDQVVLTQYVVIAARQGFDEAGEDITRVDAVAHDPAPPLHVQLGLVEYVAARYRRMAARDD